MSEPHHGKHERPDADASDEAVAAELAAIRYRAFLADTALPRHAAHHTDEGKNA